MKRALLDRLLAARAAKRPVAQVTDLQTGLATLVFEDAVHGDFEPARELLAEARRRLKADQSGMVESGGGRAFVHVHNPPLRLIVVGAVHIAQPLVSMAVVAGYDVTVVDPRRAFASDERFPGVAVSTGWPDEALTALNPDIRTAVVTLTHDPKLDDPALIVAVRSPAFYVGALGSRKTHARRVERLTAAGLAPAEIGRIHGPVGLPIEAVSPAEIAVSILAQITQVLRAGAKAHG
ncbi:MAG TPA: XdhC family protein [Azospirillaceae bacterium]|nr:XdhC family protein [Azospirillaceae bacterium]